MASLRDFEILDLFYREPEWHPYKEKPREEKPVFHISTAKDITLAEYDVSSQGTVTAHRLKDYRRKSFSLVLLPNVKTVLDDRFAPLEVVKGEILQAQSY